MKVKIYTLEELKSKYKVYSGIYNYESVLAIEGTSDMIPTSYLGKTLNAETFDGNHYFINSYFISCRFVKPIEELE